MIPETTAFKQYPQAPSLSFSLPYHVRLTDFPFHPIPDMLFLQATFHRSQVQVTVATAYNQEGSFFGYRMQMKAHY